MDTLVSKENIQSILDGCMSYINTNINSITLSAENLAKLEKINKIKLDGTGNKILSDNGEYIELDVDILATIYKDIQAVYDLFNIVITSEKWESKKPDQSLGGGRSYSSSETYDNNIYVMGGSAGTTNKFITSSVQKYNSDSDTWSTKASLLAARSNTASAICDNKIYLIGGTTGNSVLCNNNECYDINTDTWTTKASMLTNRANLCAVQYNKKIYCLGGNNSQILTKNECYDIATDTWSTKTDTASFVYGAIAEQYDGIIYYIGGYNTVGANRSNVYYNITTDTWSSKESLPNDGLYYASSSIYNDNIYIMGGQERVAITDKTICYNITTDTWSESLPLSKCRKAHTCCIYKNYIHVIGGTYDGANYMQSNERFTISTIDYNIILPDSIQSKLDIIKQDGDGTKVLADNGIYVNITDSLLTTLTEEQVTTLINEINALE